MVWCASLSREGVRGGIDKISADGARIVLVPNLARSRQSRPDYGLSFQVQVLD